jgi:hypothetical protein
MAAEWLKLAADLAVIPAYVKLVDGTSEFHHQGVDRNQRKYG